MSDPEIPPSTDNWQVKPGAPTSDELKALISQAPKPKRSKLTQSLTTPTESGAGQTHITPSDDDDLTNENDPSLPDDSAELEQSENGFAKRDAEKAAKPSHDIINGKKHGINRLGRPLEVDREAIRALYLTGMEPLELAVRYKVGHSTMRKWVQRGGWFKERENLRARAVAKVENVVQQSIEEYKKKISKEVDQRLATLNKLPTTTIRSHKEFAQALDLFDRIKRRALGLDQNNGKATAVSVSAAISFAQLPPMKVKTVDVEAHQM